MNVVNIMPLPAPKQRSENKADYAALSIATSCPSVRPSVCPAHAFLSLKLDTGQT